jgi:hypothetical protein
MLSLEGLADQQASEQILIFVFAVAQAILYFVAWMVPHRVHRLRGELTARDWTSLTVAAWVCGLSFAVLGFLPSDWPWRLLR